MVQPFKIVFFYKFTEKIFKVLVLNGQLLT